MKQSLILLAGVPAAGKSYFGQWLEKKHGYLHLDVEKDGRLQSMGLEPAWMNCFERRDAAPFLALLHRTGQPVVVNWGFPIHLLPIVQNLKDAGMTLWWLDADVEQARQEFAKRGDVPLPAFERQMAAIVGHWKAIEAVFLPNVVTTLNADGVRTPPEDLFRALFPPT